MVRRLIHMLATSAALFEAFHNHDTRLQWDTLLKQATMEGSIGKHSTLRGQRQRSTQVLSKRTAHYECR